MRGSSIESTTGTLIGTQGGLIVRMADGSVRTISNYAAVRLAALPGGLISKPTLVWDVATGRPGIHKSRFSYQTGGTTWWTDYNLTLAEGVGTNACKLDVGAWVTIVNQTGATFTHAKLKPGAGDGQPSPPSPPPSARPAARCVGTGAPARRPAPLPGGAPRAGWGGERPAGGRPGAAARTLG